jgi:hypothetical protein
MTVCLELSPCKFGRCILLVFSAIHEILDPLIANISNLDLPDCTSFLPTNTLKNMPNEVFGVERRIGVGRILKHYTT